MKLTAFLLLVACMQATARVDGQTVTITARNTPLVQVFESIKQQTGYTFMYKSSLLEKAKLVSIEIKNAQLVDVLALIFKNTPYTYQVFDAAKIVAVKHADEKAETSFTNLGPTENPFEITGKVVNEQGQPIEGVTVAVKGTSVSTVTNKNGEFSLSGVNDEAVLVFSHVGMETFEMEVKDKTEYLVKLKAKVSELGSVEIVSTGYQDIPKDRATGSFVKIDNELLNRSVSTNIIDRIYNVTSGLNFQPSNGVAKGPNIMVRGLSTINANQNPLIVVDGFPYDESTNFSNLVSDINPNDIESITVLKDAAAASIWGVRAGNGVIVIKTKKGRFNQKIRVELNENVTIGEKPNLKYIPILSSSDWIDLENILFQKGVFQLAEDYSNLYNYPVLVIPQVAEILIAKRDGKISENEANSKISALKNHDLRNDANEYLLRKSVNQQYSLNISGGSENFNFYGSLGFDHNNAATIGNDYGRFTTRFDNYYKPIKQLEINSFINYTQSEFQSNGQFMTSYPGSMVSPYTMLSDGQGNPTSIPWDYRTTYTDTVKYPGLLDWKYRPLDELRNNDNTSKQVDARFGLGLKYSFSKALNFELRYQYQHIHTNERQLYSQASYFTRNLINKYTSQSGTAIIRPVPLGSILDLNEIQQKSWNFRGQLNFSKEWRQHNIVVLAGIDSREVKSISNKQREYGYNKDFGTISVVDYITKFNTIPDFGVSSIPFINDINGTLNRYISYFGNAAYSFKEKYTFSLSGRVDGTNFFGIKSNQRITPLWSAGLKWDISKEEFYKIAWLPYLSTRITYGFNGNTNNNATPFATMLYEGNSSLGIPFATLVSPPNPDLRWEKIKMINAAIDFEFFNRKIIGSIEYYTKRGVDLIGPVITDPTTGVQSYTGNRASIKGKGIDLTISAKILSKVVNWNTDFLLSYTTDKVTSYELGAKTPLNYVDGYIVEGRPLYSLFSYRWAGLDPSNGDPRIYVADSISGYQNYLGVTHDDLLFSGRQNPAYFGSIRNTFGWKNLALSFNVVYKIDYYFKRTSINYFSLLNGSSFSAHPDYLLRWTKPGDELKTNIPSYPNATDEIRNRVYTKSSILVEKGDHVRLQDIRLSYDFQRIGKGKIVFQNIQLYLYANNLGVIWRANKHNIDPDYGDLRIPPSRSIAIGVSARF